MSLCRGWSNSPPARLLLSRQVEIGEQKLHLFIGTDRYNGACHEKRVPKVRPVLDILQDQHADNFGWSLACCIWHRDMAEDVLQEAYLRVLDGRAKFSDQSSPRTWFFAVIKHVAADVQRTRKRRSILNLRVVAADVEETGAAFTGGSQPVMESVHADETSQQLRTALTQLSVRQREILHLVFYADMTLEQAAGTVGVSVGSARTHYHRGKERLAKLLDVKAAHEQ